MSERTILRLDANEGRPCLSPESFASLIDREALRRYPDSRALEVALAAGMGLEPDRVVATAGADDAIDRAIRSFGLGGKTVLSTAPAFEEYSAAAARSGAAYASVPRSPEGAFPLAALVAAVRERRPALVVVASPDNPGGGAVLESDLGELAAECRAVSAPLLFDIAYADFDEDRRVYEAALSMPGLIVTGTFSKSSGLAGLRIGWAAGSPQDIAALRKAGAPYALGTLSVAAALLALESGASAKAAFVAEVRRERPLLRAALEAIGAESWESRANFQAAFVPDSAAFAAAMEAQGVKIRFWPDKAGRKGLVRITCPGEEGEFGLLLAALKSIGRVR
jgi:histidinol-phosphate aminotransferase